MLNFRAQVINSPSSQRIERHILITHNEVLELLLQNEGMEKYVWSVSDSLGYLNVSILLMRVNELL